MIQTDKSVEMDHGPCREDERAYRASAGVMVLEVLPLEVASNLLEL